MLEDYSRGVTCRGLESQVQRAVQHNLVDLGRGHQGLLRSLGWPQIQDSPASGFRGRLLYIRLAKYTLSYKDDMWISLKKALFGRPIRGPFQTTLAKFKHNTKLRLW